MSEGRALRTVLVKLSGEMLAGTGRTGLDAAVIDRFTAEIHEVAATGVRVGVVIGGGNIFRGVSGAKAGFDRTRGDHMGMLATVINALALQDGFERRGCPSCVLTALRMDAVADFYTRRDALAHLDAGRVLVFAGGTTATPQKAPTPCDSSASPTGRSSPGAWASWTRPPSPSAAKPASPWSCTTPMSPAISAGWSAASRSGRGSTRADPPASGSIPGRAPLRARYLAAPPMAPSRPRRSGSGRR